MLLGPPGNLQSVRNPAYGLSPRISQAGNVHRLLGGGHRVDEVGVKKRVYDLSWSGLSQAEYEALRSIFLGAYGPGPYVLVDPTETNLFPTNVATGTDSLRSTDGFAAIDGALVSDDTNVRSGARALKWTAETTEVIATGSSMTVSTSALDDVAVVAGESYTATCYAWGASVAPTLTPTIYWCDAAGSAVSSSAGSSVSTDASWKRLTVTATAPAGSAFARLALAISGASFTYNCWLDDWQFEQASAASTWVVGQGSPLVQFAPDSWAPTAVFVDVWDLTCTLVEV